MTFAAAASAAVIGLSGHLVRVKVDLSSGPGGFQVSGLPDSTSAETRDRIRAAIVNSGFDWPDNRITVNVLPADMPKYGSGLDLAIAVAILAAAARIPLDRLAHSAFVGELGLDGAVRPVRGLPCAMRALVTSGVRTIVIPAAQASEAIRCATISATSLAGLVEQLNSGTMAIPPADHSEDPPAPDLADLPGNAATRRALEITAAGGHNLLLVGDGPSAALAERLPGILPGLDAETRAEVSGVHSLTGTPWTGRRPPLCAPHHTNTAAAIFGRRIGGVVHPGAVSLGHAGVLFLDQAPEFARSILDGLRLPLETGEIILADWAGIVRLPARFQLLAAAQPCPCGASPCRCGPLERRRYLNRLAGLRDLIEITVPIQPIDWHAELGEPSAIVADRVAVARARATYRLTGTPWRTNAEIPASELRTCYRLTPEALDLLVCQLRLGCLTPSALTCVLRLAWTLADLRAVPRPTRDDAAEALRLWRGETA